MASRGWLLQRMDLGTLASDTRPSRLLRPVHVDLQPACPPGGYRGRGCVRSALWRTLSRQIITPGSGGDRLVSCGTGDRRRMDVGSLADDTGTRVAVGRAAGVVGGGGRWTRRGRCA